MNGQFGGPESPNVLAGLSPAEIIQKIEDLMRDERDPVLLANSSVLLYAMQIKHGYEFCQLMIASDEILNTIYGVLDNDKLMHEYSEAFCCATANLFNISKYEDGCAALLRQPSAQSTSGLGALIRSLRSRKVTLVIYAITAIHNLLLDKRPEVQEEAKNQIKRYKGIPNIVQLLNIAFDGALDTHYKFKVIVLDCIQILAYGKENSENRLAISRSGGPQLILKNIQDYFDQQSDDLISTASRALKSLSVCKENKKDIIVYSGIDVLTQCLHSNNPDILKTCLWTMRNLSDLINETVRGSHSNEGVLTPSVIQEKLINELVHRLLSILDEYPEDHCIVTCALGTLANLTCDIKQIKEFVCQYDGIERILIAVHSALGYLNSFNLQIAEDKRWECALEILDPTVYALCHLFNQPHHIQLEKARERLQQYFDHLFEPILKSTPISSKLAQNVMKLKDYALGDKWHTDTSCIPMILMH